MRVMPNVGQQWSVELICASPAARFGILCLPTRVLAACLLGVRSERELGLTHEGLSPSYAHKD